jgi:four helix bundle protein
VRPESGDRKPERSCGHAERRIQKEDFRFRHPLRAVGRSFTADACCPSIGKQLLRAGTSVGANYRSAIRGRSRADFIAKMGIVEEKCDEALHWIEVLCELKLITKDRIKDLQIEGNEILSITISSIKTARKNAKP